MALFNHSIGLINRDESKIGHINDMLVSLQKKPEDEFITKLAKSTYLFQELPKPTGRGDDDLRLLRQQTRLLLCGHTTDKHGSLDQRYIEAIDRVERIRTFSLVYRQAIWM